jgi:phosphoserine phosphatase
MDETITEERYISALAAATGTEAELELIVKDKSLSPIERCERITEIFKFVHRSQFEKVASSLTLKPGVIEFVNQMRRERFMVGVISSYYFAGTEIVRKRIFADFALAHVLQFKNDICTGQLQFNDAFRNEQDLTDQSLCKSHVLDQFRAKSNAPFFKEIWAIGDERDDLKMLTLANRAFVINPRSHDDSGDPHIERMSSFAEISVAVTRV